jgi:signal peptidase I
MKKTIVTILFAGAFILVLWIVARATHTFETYNMATSANEPTYKPRSVVMASRFSKPDYNKFVCFKQPNKSLWIFRCIAKEGDVVELRDTKVFLNGKQLDEPYTYNEYYVTNKQLDSIRGYVDQYKYAVRLLNDSLHLVTMTANEVKNYHVNLKQFIVTKGAPTQGIYGDFKTLKYNQDNLGPVTVPKNSYFLLGDNRHDALDSRYLGFITNDDIVSTVIN